MDGTGSIFLPSVTDAARKSRCQDSVLMIDNFVLLRLRKKCWINLKERSSLMRSAAYFQDKPLISGRRLT